MKVYKTVKGLRKKLDSLESQGLSIAFVPTMGALHEGHMSLIQIAKKQADIAIASIFVNPTQFNNPNDLAKYPRNLEEDKQILQKFHCDILFTPSVKEIYPTNQIVAPKLELHGMDAVMEGKFRPGHFEGMLQVVKRLLDIVNPRFLIMGQKDYQQISLVRLMIEQLQLSVKLIQGDSVREIDGLAMSSRNRRLDPIFRKKAKIIYEALMYCKTHLDKMKPSDLENYCGKLINEAGLKTEYFEIVDAKSLKKKSTYTTNDKLVACVAAWAGEIRLIDNIAL
ncbi:MAG: pantoate--beta-alanine ligase [Saprospiraceae bacterium]